MFTWAVVHITSINTLCANMHWFDCWHNQTSSTLVVMLCMKTQVDLNGESFVCSLAVNRWAQTSASTGWDAGMTRPTSLTSWQVSGLTDSTVLPGGAGWSFFLFFFLLLFFKMNNDNNILYSSQCEIKAAVRSHNKEHISIILSHETHAHTHS